MGASTVFAITLAIVAGLIGAWVFKMTLLPGKKPPAPAAAAYKLTVASINLTEKQEILPGNVKAITVNKEEYDRAMADPKAQGRVRLFGNQPIGRTTVKPIMAEEPVFEDQLEPLHYPHPVSEDLRPGKVAVIIEVPAKQAMVHVDDRVDVLCSLSSKNAAFGPGSTATAVIARGQRVVARFNSTRTAVQPGPGQNRTYTLETSPYRHALIELAKTIGATFALSVIQKTTDEVPGIIRGSDYEGDDPQTDRVTTADLARLFGITPVQETQLEIERWTGTQQRDSLIFEQYNRPSQTPAPPVLRPVPASPRPAPNAAPTTGKGNSTGPVSYRVRRTNATTMVSAASRADAFGFGPPAGAANAGKAGCATCGSK